MTRKKWFEFRVKRNVMLKIWTLMFIQERGRDVWCMNGMGLLGYSSLVRHFASKSGSIVKHSQTCIIRPACRMRRTRGEFGEDKSTMKNYLLCMMLIMTRFEDVWNQRVPDGWLEASVDPYEPDNAYIYNKIIPDQICRIYIDSTNGPDIVINHLSQSCSIRIFEKKKFEMLESWKKNRI